jgi:hypothetical protein
MEPGKRTSFGSQKTTKGQPSGLHGFRIHSGSIHGCLGVLLPQSQKSNDGFLRPN